MKIPKSNSTFESCPEFRGRAVCVDITPLRKYETQFGPKDKFKIVFEVDLLNEKKSQPYAVWSRPMTPSSHENGALSKFLKDWFGRVLTEAEWDAFDTEQLIGRPADLTVVHEHINGEVYSNIKLIMPYKGNDPLKPSGKFVRAKDRQDKGADGNGSSYRRAEQSPGTQTEEWAKTKVHVGRHKGLELRELSKEAIHALLENWLPAVRTSEKQTADDKRLISALEEFVRQENAREQATTQETDDLQY